MGLSSLAAREPSLLPGADRLHGLFHDLEEDFPLPDHAELVARTLLDRLGALLEVAHLRGEGGVARLEAGVAGALRGELALQRPGPQPAALSQPQRVLDEDDERAQDAGEELHPDGLMRAARRPRVPDSRPSRRGPPRCAEAGCTSPRGRSATATRS